MQFEFKFPDVGEGVHEGKVLKLNVAPGDTVEEGDILAVVETDKVVAEIPAPRDGRVEQFAVTEGQIIQVGETLAVLEVEDGGMAAPKEEEDVGSVVGAIEGPLEGVVLPPSGEGIADRSVEAIGLVEHSVKVLASPVARKMAADLGVTLSTVHGTGPGGRVLKRDVAAAAGGAEKIRPASLSAVSSAAPSPVAPVSAPVELVRQPVATGQTEVIAFSQLRKTIARNMEASQEIPAFVMHDQAVVDALWDFRQRINAGKSNEEKISFIPLFMKALAVAIGHYPMMNGTYNPKQFETTLHSDVNIGFAVNTDDGLIVPVIKNVESKTIVAIGREMRQLAERALNRTLSLEETRGGTITITNYGPFGGLYGRPMILPPQLAIVGFGRMEEQPVVKDGEVVAARVLPVSMVVDHRAVDGAPAGQFLSFFLALLGDYARMALYL